MHRKMTLVVIWLLGEFAMGIILKKLQSHLLVMAVSEVVLAVADGKYCKQKHSVTDVENLYCLHLVVS
jgi:hypothetical protein